jgi:hypothetical protein
MKKFLKLGAPSRTGVDANKAIADVFTDEDFPLLAKVTNLVAHAINFPEINGLHAGPVTDEKNFAIVEIGDLSAFHRLASSIEQVAELNRHDWLLTIEEFPRLDLSLESENPDEEPDAGDEELDGEEDDSLDDEQEEITEQATDTANAEKKPGRRKNKRGK